jgi:hypothetical protein
MNSVPFILHAVVLVESPFIIFSINVYKFIVICLRWVLHEHFVKLELNIRSFWKDLLLVLVH